MDHKHWLPESIERGEWESHQATAYLSQVFSHHVKGLHIAAVQEKKIQQCLFTGSLLNLNGACLWMTAGHVAREIEKICTEEMTYKRAHILDGYPEDGADSVPLPLLDLKLVCYDKDGIDLGFIRIPDWSVHALLANPNTKLLDPSVWKDRYEAHPEAYYLVGMPEEWTKFTEEPASKGTEVSVNAVVACVPVRMIPDRPADKPASFWGKADALYAEVLECLHDDGQDLKNLVGTSGGLIFGVRRENGGLRYWLYGIQSSWLPESRILRATDIGLLDGIVKRQRAGVPVGAGHADARSAAGELGDD